MEVTNMVGDLLRAVRFAADKHRDQRRRGIDASPYINHPIEVTELISRVGEVDDLAVLIAAILHDTVEDTKTTLDEIESAFGVEVRNLVAEVTDDKTLSKAERKQLQVEHTPHISDRAKLIKVADKSCNVRDIAHSPPHDWNAERRSEYLEWASRVVDGCRGTNDKLERHFDETLARATEASRNSGLGREHDAQRIDKNMAKSLALEYLAVRYSRSINLVRTDLAVGEVYAFDPTGWIVFAVVGSEHRVGATELVAVHEETGEVRYLGRSGE
jgi:guanosine-3',5'-bis(diphosphate) 3'-pyrophosphohydrolase